jgi:hypothetical protein
MIWNVNILCKRISISFNHSGTHLQKKKNNGGLSHKAYVKKNPNVGEMRMLFWKLRERGFSPLSPLPKSTPAFNPL